MNSLSIYKHRSSAAEAMPPFLDESWAFLTIERRAATRPKTATSVSKCAQRLQHAGDRELLRQFDIVVQAMRDIVSRVYRR